MSDYTRILREQSLFQPTGRIFLMATAHAYGYEIDEQYNIVDEDGAILPTDHSDYTAILKMAREQVSKESDIGRDLYSKGIN